MCADRINADDLCVIEGCDIQYTYLQVSGQAEVMKASYRGSAQKPDVNQPEHTDSYSEESTHVQDSAQITQAYIVQMFIKVVCDNHHFKVTYIFMMSALLPSSGSLINASTPAIFTDSYFFALILPQSNSKQHLGSSSLILPFHKHE